MAGFRTIFGRKSLSIDAVRTLTRFFRTILQYPEPLLIGITILRREPITQKLVNKLCSQKVWGSVG